MAILHQATLQPTKLELLAAWLPSRDWFTSSAGEVQRVAAFRLDDPAGAVGIETMLVQVGDEPVYQVPLTYRDAPLVGGDEWLVGTTEHSVLGKRWVYDACGDPVYAATLASAILADGGQAEQFVQVGDSLEPREPSMTIASSATANWDVQAVSAIIRVVDGEPTLIVTDTVELSVVRRLDASVALPGTVLSATWPEQPTPITLAAATLPH